MANHLSALKRIRQNAKNASRNKGGVSRIRTFLRKFETAVLGGDSSVIEESFRHVQAELALGAKKGILHANTASRKISRLNRRVKALSTNS